MKYASGYEARHVRHETPSDNDIIYLYPPKKTAKRARINGDLIWELVFTAGCLSVLAVLFLH